MGCSGSFVCHNIGLKHWAFHYVSVSIQRKSAILNQKREYLKWIMMMIDHRTGEYL